METNPMTHGASQNLTVRNSGENSVTQGGKAVLRQRANSKKLIAQFLLLIQQNSASIKSK